MRVLVDTNVIADWLMCRSPFFNDSKYIIMECLKGNIEGFITSHTVTDLFYILRKDFSVEKRKQLLLLLCRHFNILIEDKNTIISALSNDSWNDLEDGLQMLCAYLNKLDYVITRDIEDFRSSKIPAVSPHSFIEKSGENFLSEQQRKNGYAEE